MFLKEAYMFCEATTIHGLSYLSTNQSKSTRIIWTLIVLAAFGIASYFLYQTIDGFDTKYTSTTVEDRNIKDYPFPSVTFDPGEFNMENSFLRTFLNQFEFTRYKVNSPMRDNQVFLKQFDWLISRMHNKVFESIEKFLLTEKTFIKAKGNIFKDETCYLVALNIKKKIPSLKIRNIFLRNMYKYNNFKDLLSFLRKEVSPLIIEAKSQYNLTKSEISTACKDRKNEKIKSMMEAMLLSYMYLFLGKKNTNLGAGDIATSSLGTGLSPGAGTNKHGIYYRSTHEQLNKIYNYMTNSTLPASILKGFHLSTLCLIILCYMKT